MSFANRIAKVDQPWSMTASQISDSRLGSDFWPHWKMKPRAADIRKGKIIISISIC